MKIKLLQIKEATGEKIISPDIIAEMMSEEAKADRECMWVLHLNAKNRIIEKELVHMGSLNSSIVHPREVFKKAILLSAKSIITVHNHPSGDPTPSSQDKAIWDRLRKGGEILGIDVIHNVIISSSEKWYSEKLGK